MSISAASCEIQTDIKPLEAFGNAARRPETIGFVTAFEPGAKIIRNGQEIPLCNNPDQGVGMDILKGDKIITTDNTISVIYTNNAEEKIPENSQAALGLKEREMRLDEAKGVVSVAAGDVARGPDRLSVTIRNDTNLAVTG